MKRKLWTAALLAAFLAALCCIAAADSNTPVTRNVFGIVRASELEDEAIVRLTGATTLIMDTDRCLSSIRGPHPLTIEGSCILNVDTSRDLGNGIEVYSLYCTADIHVYSCIYYTGGFAFGDDGIHAEHDITISDAYAHVWGGDHGICSENGNISLNLKDRSSGQVSTLATVEAESGSVSITGHAELPMNSSAPSVKASGDISMTQGTFVFDSSDYQRALQAGRNITIGGDVSMMGGKDVGGGTGPVIQASNGSVTILNGSSVRIGSMYGIEAKSISMAGGSLSMNVSDGYGLYASQGDILLSGTVSILSCDSSVYAPHGSIQVNGSLTARNTNDNICIAADTGITLTGGTSTITSSSDCPIVLNTYGDIVLGGKVTINGANSGTTDWPYSVYSHEGNITLLNGCDVSVGGKYGLGAKNISMMGGRLTANIQESMAVRALDGSISLIGTAILTSYDTVLYAPYGGIMVNGSLTASNYCDNICIAADRYITLTGGRFIINQDETGTMALRTNGYITLGGYVTIRGGGAYSSVMAHSVLAEGGGLTIESGSTVSVTGRYGVRADSLDMQGESLSVSAAEGKAIQADSGEFSIVSPLVIRVPQNGRTEGSTIVTQDGSAASEVVIDRRAFTLSFAPNGASGVMTSVTVRDGVPYMLPVCTFSPAEGYVFAGWKIGNEVYPAGAAATFTGSATAVAQWTRDYYVIRFEPGGGGGNTITLYLNVGQKLTVPECSFTPPEGREFECWHNAARPSVQPGTQISVTGDITLYAKWKKIVCAVSYDPAGGEGSMPGATLEWGDMLTLPDCAFTPPEGMEFDRWDLGAPGEEVAITADTEIVVFWKYLTLTVSFDTKNRRPIPDQYVIYGGTAARPADPYDPAWDFRGWFTDYDGTEEYDFSTPVTEDITIYAKWGRDIRYRVEFNLRGMGGEDFSVQVLEGDPVSEPPTPYTTLGTGSGYYAFAGWYTDFDCTDGNEWDFSQPVSQDMDLWAKWDVVPYIRWKGGSMTGTGTSCYGFDDFRPQVSRTTLTWSTSSAPSSSLYTYEWSRFYTDADLEHPASTRPEYVSGTDFYFCFTISSVDPEYIGIDWTSGYGYIHMDVTLDGFTVTLESAKYLRFNEAHTDVTSLRILFKATTPERYTVTFDRNGKGGGGFTAGGTFMTTSVLDGKTVSRPSYSPDSGYTALIDGEFVYRPGYWAFTDWYQEPECENLFDFSTPIHENITLYAGWEYRFDASSTLFLPSGLQGNLQPESFSGIAARAVVIPEGVTYIPDGAIAGSSLMVIYGYGEPGTGCAWNYANRNGLLYIRIDDAWVGSHSH